MHVKAPFLFMQEQSEALSNTDQVDMMKADGIQKLEKNCEVDPKKISTSKMVSSNAETAVKTEKETLDISETISDILKDSNLCSKSKQKVDIVHRTILRLVRRFYMRLFAQHNSKLVRLRYSNCAYSALVSGMRKVVEK